MEDAGIDLAEETAEYLGTHDPAAVAKWRKGRLKFEIWGLSLLCVGLIICWLLARFFQYVPDWLAIMWGLMGFGVTALGAIFAISQAIPLIRGMPLAPRTPEMTIQLFYDKTLTTLSADRLEAYVCLLGQARKALGGVEGFLEHYKKANAALREAITARLPPNLRNLVAICYGTPSARECDSPAPNLRTYEVDIEAKQSTGEVGLVGNPYRVVGTATIRERCTVACVDGRWYLTCGTWTGKLIDGPNEPSQADQK